MPKVNYLPADVIHAIGEFSKKGGTVLVSSPSFGFDEHGNKHTGQIKATTYPATFNPSDVQHTEMFDQILTRAGTQRPIRVKSLDNRFLPHLEARTVVLGPGRYQTFVLNRSDEPTTFALTAARPIHVIRESIELQNLTNPVTIAPSDILMLEIETE